MADRDLRELERRWRSSDDWLDWCAWARAARQAGDPKPRRVVVLVDRIASRTKRLNRIRRHDEALAQAVAMSPAVEALEQQWSNLAGEVQRAIDRDRDRLARLVAQLVTRELVTTAPPTTWPMPMLTACGTVRNRDRQLLRDRRIRGRGRADLRAGGRLTEDGVHSDETMTGPHRRGDGPTFMVRNDGVLVATPPPGQPLPPLPRILGTFAAEAWHSVHRRRLCVLCRQRRLVDQPGWCHECHDYVRLELERLGAGEDGEVPDDEDLDALLATM